MHPRTEVIQSGKVRNLDVTESLTYQGVPVVPGGGGGGTTGFTPTQNTAAPNATINASRLLVDVVTSSGDAVLQPKGFGAVMAQLPDSTDVGGNKRGSYAVDWQMHRATAAQVATGNYSVVLGGSSNTASQDYSVVGGRQNTVTGYSAIAAGYLNQTQNTYCFIGAGQSNTASGDKSIVVGGQSNTASATHSVVVGGTTNVASYAYASLVGGSNNTAGGYACSIGGGDANNINSFGDYAVIIGGRNNRAWKAHAVVLGGNENYADHENSIAMGQYSATIARSTRVMASSRFSVNGDAQLVEVVLMSLHDNELTTTRFSPNITPGSENVLMVPNNTTMSFNILVTARRTSPSLAHAAWEIRGLIANNGGTTALFGTPSYTVINSVAGLDIQVQANDTDDRLALIPTTGGASVRWVAHVRAVMVRS